MKTKNYLKNWLKIAYLLVIGAIILLPRPLSAQEISINVENQKLSSVLEIIQRQVPYKFAYNNSIIDVNRVVTLNIKGKSLEQTLNILFENTDVTFQISANQIILSSKTLAQNKQQEIQVKGVIKDIDSGEPVPFASIQIKGTAIGTTTDDLGNYVLDVPSNGYLIFSSIGYKPVELPINNRAVINLDLSPDVESLDNVIVVAYGTAKKESYSGSAATIKSDAILENPTSSFEQAMQGKVSGMQVVTNSGQPGASTSFRIRGSGSLNASNEPLYVIDGVATTSTTYSMIADDASSSSSILSSINPQDIESITVLKDAAAASLYGSRAANGVVIITTKSGKKGEGKFNINAQVGVSAVPKRMDLMNSSEYYETVFQSYFRDRKSQGFSASDAATWANAQTQGLITFNPYSIAQPYDANGKLVSGAKIIVDTDWQKEVLTPGLTQDYNGSFSGGTDKMSYFFSGGFYDQKGTSPSSRYTRYSGKTNISAQIKPWLRAGMNATFSLSNQNTEVAGGAGASPLYNALYFPNGVPIYMTDSSGNLILDENGEKQFNWLNPVSKDFNPLAIPYMDINKTKTYRLLASMFVEIKFMEGLKLKTTFSPDYVNLYEIKFWNKNHGNGPAYGGRSERHQTHDLMITSTTTLDFNRRFAEDKHGISAMIGFEAWQSTLEYALAQGTNFAFDFMNELVASTNPLSPSSWTSKEVLLSYIARAEYDYDNKYFISGSFRRDGSSVFGEDNKWGNFFSVGATWRIDNESFLKDIRWINSLKLRASYGTSGNNLGVKRYQSLGIWSAGDQYNYGKYPGFAHTQFANPDLGWEKQAMFNVGIDYAFLDHRIYGSIEYYNKTSKDLLYQFPLPSSHGISSVMKNLAKVSNSGFEFEIGAEVIRRNNFSWDLSFNFAASSDKILDLAGNDDVVMSTTKKIWKIGYSQYEFYMPTWMGVDKTNGKPLWKKGDGTTSEYGQADYDLQGRATPVAYGGFQNTLHWKGLSLSFMLYYSIGGKVYDSIYASVMHEGGEAGKNMHRDDLKAWTPESPNSDIPAIINAGTLMTNSESTRFLFDATYIKLKNVNLSYTFPKKIFGNQKIISGAKVYVNADNLLTWFKDDWKGYDDIDIYGVGGYNDLISMPLSRTLTFGVNLTF
jgi:TonB-linked SusC/RagA family outer membrane protein